MHKFQKYRGMLLLIALSWLPVFLWLNSYGFELAFTSSVGTAIASMGKLTALVGYTLYCLMPVLSMRHRAIEMVFGSMDRVYRLHTQSGKIAFYLILLHPILLGLGRYISGRPFGQVWDWSSLVVILGIIGMTLLAIITFAAIYAHIRHQKWILIHRIFGLLIPLFFFHGYFAGSQMVQVQPLSWYLISVTIIGFLAFVYRSVFGRWLVKRHRYEVAEVNRFTPTVMEVVLKPKGIPIHYQAGQFAFVSFKHPQLDSEAHPYSFSNAHNGPYVRFAIKALGDDTKRLSLLTPGTPAYLEGPYGRFSYRNTNNHKQVWIAGGIGITPFLSMARSFSGRQHYDIKFYYGTESLEEAVFLQEFLDIMRHLPENFDVKVVSKNLSGFITLEKLEATLKDVTLYDYFICGPPGMMKSLQEQLLSAGVVKDQIHIEAFSM